MTSVNEELRRLVDLLPNTPPGDDYIRTLQCIECLGGLADTIDEVLNEDPTERKDTNVVRLVQPEIPAAATPEPAAPTETTAESRNYDRAEVRAMLGGLRLNGNDMTDLLALFDARTFADIPEDKYPEVVAYVKEHY